MSKEELPTNKSKSEPSQICILMNCYFLNQQQPKLCNAAGVKLDLRYMSRLGEPPHGGVDIIEVVHADKLLTNHTNLRCSSSVRLRVDSRPK